ncbi:MAG TPA: formate/nitrite transporter family protein [Methylotenera sp.]|nr:formate/nitrite transporter family protein [Methylotenera sp.]
MSYLTPSQFVKKMVDAGETKLKMAPRDVLIRAYMAGAILTLAVAFAVTTAVQTGMPIVGALVFPVGFVLLNLVGFDLLTGVFALVPLALYDKRKGCTFKGMMKNWGLVGLGNLLGALTTAILVGTFWTYGFSAEPGAAGKAIAKAAEARTLGYAEYGAMGWLTVFIAGVLCNWMVSVGVVGAMLSDSVGGKILTMWLPITIFFGLVFEHLVVNMFLFPMGMMMGAEITIADWLTWNEIPVILGNLVGGLVLTGGVLYATHYKTGKPTAEYSEQMG